MPAQTYTLHNGLVVAFEHRAGPGFAFDIRLPRGSIHDPTGLEGLSSITEEWLYKGAGTRNSRAFQDALDDLGVRRSGSSGFEATRLAASGLNEDLHATLSLYADLVQRPYLSPQEIPTLLDLARQDLESYQDSPTTRLSLMTREQSFAGSGYAWPIIGTLESLNHIDAASAAEFFGSYGAAGSILAVVADQEAQQVFDWAQQLFGNWQAGAGVGHSAAQLLSSPQPHLGLQRHLHIDTQQTHISLMGKGVSPHSDDWYAWHVALAALSSGSASRLFHAVREERGLAYSISATAQLAGHTSLLTAYAGSTPERAQETLEVTLSELGRWQRGLERAEFERAKNTLIASTVFGTESIRACSIDMTRDLALYGTIYEATQNRAAIEALTLEQINDFLGRYQIGPLNVFSVGPHALSLPLSSSHP